MDTIRAMSEPSEGTVPDYWHAGPTVLRMLVGAQLRRLREACMVSAERAAHEIRCSNSKISRMELGRVGFKERDIADLLTLYGVTDPDERATLLALAKQANAPGWWHSYGDVVPNWFEPYLGLEHAASLIHTYEPQFVPGLLQTEGYARAVVRAGHPQAHDTEIERRVALRMHRGRVLARDEPPRLWVVVDEAVLRRPYGGRATMRTQLRHLIEMAELRHVTVQVLPFAAGGHAAAGPVTILRMPESNLPRVVYLEQLTNAGYPDRPDEIDHYGYVMNSLVLQAKTPAESVDFLHRVLEET